MSAFGLTYPTAQPVPDVSIVVGVYNEAGNCQPLVEQISRAMRGIRYELIYVNDGSTDETLAELRSIRDSHLTILELSTNYGQSLALAAGIEAARGTYIVTLDGDQQNDPADIPRLLQYAQAHDLDLVMGQRANRQDGFWLRRLPSRVANGLIRRATGVSVRDMGCGLKVLRANLAKRLGLYGELHRFLPVLAQLAGGRMAQLPVNHRPRQIGQSKYGLSRTLKVVSDLLLLLFLKKYRHKPMHLFGTAGVLLTGAGLLALGYAGLRAFASAEPAGAALTAGLVLTIGGLQFIAGGILAELQVRTYYESQAKPPYHIRHVYRPGKPDAAEASRSAFYPVIE